MSWMKGTGKKKQFTKNSHTLSRLFPHFRLEKVTFSIDFKCKLEQFPSTCDCLKQFLESFDAFHGKALSCFHFFHSAPRSFLPFSPFADGFRQRTHTAQFQSVTNCSQVIKYANERSNGKTRRQQCGLAEAEKRRKRLCFIEQIFANCSQGLFKMMNLFPTSSQGQT